MPQTRYMWHDLSDVSLHSAPACSSPIPLLCQRPLTKLRFVWSPVFTHAHSLCVAVSYSRQRAQQCIAGILCGTRTCSYQCFFPWSRLFQQRLLTRSASLSDPILASVLPLMSFLVVRYTVFWLPFCTNLSLTLVSTSSLTSMPHCLFVLCTHLLSPRQHSCRRRLLTSIDPLCFVVSHIVMKIFKRRHRKHGRCRTLQLPLIASGRHQSTTAYKASIARLHMSGCGCPGYVKDSVDG